MSMGAPVMTFEVSLLGVYVDFSFWHTLRIRGATVSHLLSSLASSKPV